MLERMNSRHSLKDETNIAKLKIDERFPRKLQTLFFFPSLYFISKCKDAIPSWPVLNFEMFVSSFTLCLLLILSSILFNTDHTVTFYQISIYFDTKVNYITRKSSLKKTWTQNIFHWPLKKETDSNMRKL